MVNGGEEDLQDMILNMTERGMIHRLLDSEIGTRIEDFLRLVLPRNGMDITEIHLATMMIVVEVQIDVPQVHPLASMHVKEVFHDPSHLLEDEIDVQDHTEMTMTQG